MFWSKNKRNATFSFPPDINIQILRNKNIYTLRVRERAMELTNFKSEDINDCFDVLYEHFGRETAKDAVISLREQIDKEK